MAKNIQQSFQRVEKKYLLTLSQYNALLKGLMPHMKTDTYGNYTICNIYYDTDNYELIRASLEKPVYKEKLRLRSYGTPGDDKKVFVEIKKKFDHVVYKRRTVLPCNEAVGYLAGETYPQKEDQICHEIDWFLKMYQPESKVFIAYERIALAGIDNEELRITFDTNLRWRDYDLDLRKGDHGQPLLPQDQILMEIKIPGTAPMWLSHLLSKTGIFPTSFSKYGTCYKKHLLNRSLPRKNSPVSLRQSDFNTSKSMKEAPISA